MAAKAPGVSSAPRRAVCGPRSAGRAWSTRSFQLWDPWASAEELGSCFLEGWAAHPTNFTVEETGVEVKGPAGDHSWEELRLHSYL